MEGEDERGKRNRRREVSTESGGEEREEKGE